MTTSVVVAVVSDKKISGDTDNERKAVTGDERWLVVEDHSKPCGMKDNKLKRT